MKQNIKIAKELIKLAKSLVAENKLLNKWVFYNDSKSKKIYLETIADFAVAENNKQENFEDAIVRIS